MLGPTLSQSITFEEWDAYVMAHPRACGYHQIAWCEVIERSFGHKTFRIAVRNSTGEVVGVLPLVYMRSRLFGNFIVSVPFFNYGGLLCDDSYAASLLLEEAERLRRELGAAYVEFRHRSEDVVGLPTKTHKVTMILELENDEQSQWKKLDAKVRNQVRKAEKCGLHAVTGSFELLDGFYDVFCRNMRDLGTPVYGKDFFHNILETLQDKSNIISIKLNGKTIASGLLVCFRNTLEVPWASSIRDYRDLCPNNLLYWEAIKFAINNNANKFDFGRSTPGEGTYHFKKQWGAEPITLYWQYLPRDSKVLPELNPKNPKYLMATRIWQKLPVRLTRLLGPRIVKSIP